MKKKTVKNKPKKRAPAKAVKDLGKLVNFKATRIERGIIKANARKYTHGSISKWLRLVGANPAFLKANRVRISAATV